jgi:hypothetical protein
MTYNRVIPRDLFNEGNLLKCMGQLYLNLEKLHMEECLQDLSDGSEQGWWIRQDPADGSLSMGHVQLKVRGKFVRLMRPLNARRPYPLWAYPDEDLEIEVFEDNGQFTAAFRSFLLTGDVA